MEYDKWKKQEWKHKNIFRPLACFDDAEEGVFVVWFQTDETTLWDFYTKDKKEASCQLQVKKEQHPEVPVKMAVRVKGEWKTV